MKLLRKFGWVALGGMLFLLIAELLLQWLPTSTATKMGLHDGKPFASYPANHRFQSASGWDLRDPISHRTNAHGFATSAPRDLSKPGIGMVGDSMVEGSALPENQRVTEQLRRLLPRTDPVMLGFPGASLMSYLDHMAWATKTLGVERFVVFVNGNDANESVCTSAGGPSRCFDDKTAQIVASPVTRAESRVRDALARSALAQYVSGHLKFSVAAISRKLLPKRALGASEATQRPPGAFHNETARAALKHFADTVAAQYGSRVLLVFDCERTRLYAGDPPRSQEIYEALRPLAREHNIPILDLRPAFAESFRLEARRTEVSQTDSHWNARGHRIAAEAIAHTLRASP